MLDRILDQQDIGYSLVDKHLIIQTTNSKFGEWFGINGINQSLLLFFPELVGLEDSIQEMRSKPEAQIALSQIHRSIDGRDCYFDLLIRQSLDEEELYIVTARDVTRQSYLEQELRQERNELRLKQAQLHRYAKQLEIQNEDLNTFAHTVAHDLKNPLNAIIGGTDFLIELGSTLSASERVEMLNTVIESAYGMTTIINELLLLAKVQEMTEINIEPIDMEMMVQTLEKRLSYDIRHSQAVLTSPTTWPQAVGYAPWIEEVWANYLSNALKYGGNPPVVQLGATVQTDGFIRFWVQDNGQGVTEAQQQNLFKPFSRLDQVGTEGHGLGLSIARRIIEKLGGDVGVESEGIPGLGCTFFFTLPAA